MAGGIAPAILPELKTALSGSHEDKGRFILEGIPVYVILNDGMQMQRLSPNYLMMKLYYSCFYLISFFF